MPLDLNQVKELIKRPKNERAIKEAIYQEGRLKHHGEPRITRGDSIGNQAEKDFLLGVEDLLPKMKYKRFNQLYTYPVKTNEFFEGAFSNFYKVFQSNNSYIKCEFEEEEQEAEFEPIQQDILDWFRVQGFRNSQTRINGLIIVDTPSDGGDPYFSFWDISGLIDIENKENGDAEYVIYDLRFPDSDVYAVFDDESYRIVELDGEDLKLIEQSFHGLGWCPARMMWTDDLSHRDHIVKKSPFSKSLGRLDTLLFKQVSKDYADLYSCYPILSAYRTKCDYTDDFDNACNGGSVYYADHSNPTLVGETLDCPSCKGSDLIGAGTVFWVDPPEDKEQHDGIEPIKRLDADVESLEYINKDISDLEDQIFFDVVGATGEVKNDQAKNEKQIVSSFESQQNALLQYKRNIELIIGFVTKTSATLKYGDDFKGCISNLGDQFFLATEEQLKDDIIRTKEAGMPSWEVNDLINQLASTKYKNSPDQRTRVMVLMDLDPFPTSSIKEIVEIEVGLDPIDVIIKKNFDQFISRFERENANLVTFGKNTEYNTKIDKIKDAIKTYAEEKAGSLVISGDASVGPEVNKDN